MPKKMAKKTDPNAPLYLACYVIETEVEKLSLGSFATFDSPPIIERSPYFTEDDRYLSSDNLEPYVIRREKPQTIVSLGINSDAIVLKALLSTTLEQLNFTQNEHARWCVTDEGKKRHATVLFYIVAEDKFTDVNRKSVLSRVCTVDDFYPRFFETSIQLQGLDVQYRPLSHTTACAGVSTKRRVKLPQKPSTEKPPTEEPDGPTQAVDQPLPSGDVDTYLTRLETLADEPDNGDDNKRFFRYRKTAPLVIYKFLQKLNLLSSIERQDDVGIEASSDKPERSQLTEEDVEIRKRRMAIVKKAKEYDLPAEEKSDKYWIARQHVPKNHNVKYSSLQRQATNTQRGAEREPDKLSGWDYKGRYWKSRSLEGTVYYFLETIDDPIPPKSKKRRSKTKKVL